MNRRGVLKPAGTTAAAAGMKEAIKYNVLPIDDRTLERLNAALVGRPGLMAGSTSLTVFDGMTGMSENVFINTKNRSHTITAEVSIPKVGANGVILAQAGRFGGWSFYLKNGKPTYTYNFLWLQRSSYDHALREVESLRDAALYIWQNPVRAGIIDCAFGYPWSGSLVWPDWKAMLVFDERAEINPAPADSKNVN